MKNEKTITNSGIFFHFHNSTYVGGAPSGSGTIYDWRVIPNPIQRDKLNNIILQFEKMVNENKEKLPGEEANKVQATLDEAKGVLKDKADDKEALEKAYSDLIKASHSVAQNLLQ